MDLDSPQMEHLREIAAQKAAELRLRIEDGARGGISAYILVAAQARANEALAELATVNPTETEKIRELQFTVRWYDDVKNWLNDAVDRGQKIYDAMDEGSRQEIETAILGSTGDQ